MARERIEAGTTIFAEGAPSETVGYIVEGEVEILKQLGDDFVFVGKAFAGEYIGEMAALEGRDHSATVRAATTVTLDRLPKQDFLIRAANDAVLSRKLLTRMSGRLDHLNTMYAETFGVSGIAEPPDALQDHAGLAVSLKPGSAALEWPVAQVPDPLPLPFTVGRRPSWGEPPAREIVALQLNDEQPFRLSRAHFTILEEGGQAYVRDLHSHLGTEVNGHYAGIQVGKDIIALDAGDNIVIAGGRGSPFVFRIHVSV